MNRLALCGAILAILSAPAFAERILTAEPPENALRTGKRVLVDDGSCPPGQILQVIGGHRVQRIPRQRVCIARR
jgi:hypothetical protein